MRVQATVKSQQGFGLVCEVDGQRIPGVVRNLEISWNPLKQKAGSLPAGQSFTAVVTGYDEDWRELVLSIKGAEAGPFDRFADTHAIGQVIDATIVRGSPEGYVLSLEGDLEAILPHGEVPIVSNLCKQHIEESDALLEGDDVRVVLTKIDRTTKTVSVSLTDYVAKLIQETQCRIKTAMEAGKSEFAFLTAPASKAPQESQPSFPRHALSILIAEDNEALRNQLVPLFKARGHSVLATGDSGEARRMAQNLDHLDVVLLDLQLKDGLAHVNDWVQDLRAKQENAKVYLFTANVGVLLAGSGHSVAEQIDGVIQKPAEITEIIAIVEGELPASPLLQTAPETPEFTARSSGIVLPQGIEDYFVALQSAWSGCRPALLSYDPKAAQVRAIRVRGLDAKEINARSTGLTHSPIGNGLADGRSVEETIHSTSSNTLKEVLKSVNANCVYGFPLHVSSGRQTIGLFVFSPPAHKGTAGDSASMVDSGVERNLAQIAAELSVAIERARLEEEIQRQQRAACVGNLILGMAHEIRNAVQSLETFRHNIQLAVCHQAVGTNVPPVAISDALAGMHSQIRSLSENLEMFLGMARVSKTDMQPLDGLLRETVHSCANSAAQWNVVVTLDLPHEIKYPSVSATLRQAFMNLIMNGVQHSAYAPVERGLVEVSVEAVELTGVSYILMRVHDNGLGIHHCHRSQIFDMFFTTRNEGTGLGLYVTSRILENIGATIEIENSFRYGGTTLRVRIPVKHTN
jgi:signal transduction histidine kinase/ActR/RegA family two-component response regulator